ncbi:hypothetical protein J6590_014890 [Homalodisca vitripennis]|nr:hypothetical protein J6590_014890 [Homalodisca vitripennis]
MQDYARRAVAGEEEDPSHMGVTRHEKHARLCPPHCGWGKNRLRAKYFCKQLKPRDISYINNCHKLTQLDSTVGHEVVSEQCIDSGRRHDFDRSCRKLQFQLEWFWSQTTYWYHTAVASTRHERRSVKSVLYPPPGCASTELQRQKQAIHIDLSDKITINLTLDYLSDGILTNIQVSRFTRRPDIGYTITFSGLGYVIGTHRRSVIRSLDDFVSCVTIRWRTIGTWHWKLLMLMCWRMQLYWLCINDIVDLLTT